MSSASRSGIDVGRAQALLPLASPAGTICVLALDHRDAMRNAYKRAGIETVEEATMLALKVRIAAALGPRSSAILLDRAALDSCRRPGQGVMMPLEQQGHEPLEGGRLNRLLEDFGPADAAAAGAQACKLLLYYRADHAASATRQRRLVEAVAGECHAHGLALVVEPIVYRLEDESEERHAATFEPLVIAAARELSGSGADLLKLQFPGSAEACVELTEAASPLPWTLLGGSDVDGETFAEQLRVASLAGASGFIAGRAVWGPVLGFDPGTQWAWLDAHARPLYDRLADIADTYARRIR